MSINKLQQLSAVLLFSLFASLSFAQSTGAVQGVVTDAAGASIPNAALTINNQATGEARNIATDSTGAYSLPSLPVGTYRIEVKSAGMAAEAASNVIISVGTITRQDFLA
jgi:hypothetical protein